MNNQQSNSGEFAAPEPEQTTIALSQLGRSLKVSVPDSEKIGANWYVYAILGAEPEAPAWASEQEVPCGEWDYDADDVKKKTGIELDIPKEVLAKYQNSEIQLRYKFSDESSFEPYSEPVLLMIKP